MLLVAAELMQRVAPTTIFLLLFLWLSGISYRAISTVTCTQQKATSEGVGCLGSWGQRDALCRGYCEIRRLPFLFTGAMFEIWSYSLPWQKCGFPIEGLVSKCSFNGSVDYKCKKERNALNAPDVVHVGLVFYQAWKYQDASCIFFYFFLHETTEIFEVPLYMLH